MSKIESLQDIAAAEFAKKKAGAQFDPTIILVIAEMVMVFIEVLGDCQEANDAAEIANDPTRLQKRWVALKARRLLGRSEYRQSGADVVDAVLETGKQVTADDMEAAFAEIG